jgi:hypothetical protein
MQMHASMRGEKNGKEVRVRRWGHAPLRMDLAPRKSARRVQDVGGTSYPVIEP